jgi:hypothetical protein
MSTPVKPPLDALICFHDADRFALPLIEAHLAPLVREKLLRIWHVDKIQPGEVRESSFLDHLARANLILLLVSADFNQHWDRRITLAIRSAPEEGKRVFPISLRPCVWTALPFFGLQPLPKNAGPLIVRGTPDEEQFNALAFELREVILSVRTRGGSDSPASTSANSALFQTLAQVERERHALELAFAEAPATTTAAVNAFIEFDDPDTGPLSLAGLSMTPLPAERFERSEVRVSDRSNPQSRHTVHDKPTGEAYTTVSTSALALLHKALSSAMETPLPAILSEDLITLTVKLISSDTVCAMIREIAKKEAPLSVGKACNPYQRSSEAGAALELVRERAGGSPSDALQRLHAVSREIEHTDQQLRRDTVIALIALDRLRLALIHLSDDFDTFESHLTDVLCQFHVSRTAFRAACQAANTEANTPLVKVQIEVGEQPPKE